MYSAKRASTWVSPDGEKDVPLVQFFAVVSSKLYECTEIPYRYPCFVTVFVCVETQELAVVR